MNIWQCFIKRGFDICLAIFGLVVFGWLILVGWIISTIDTGKNGLYIQERVGRNGKVFRIIKIRTMKTVKGVTSVFTARNDPRITRIGSLLRRIKLDELPQLINVLLGQMSFVGPRPDVVGFADVLLGEDRIILSIRPGVTGPATLAFSNEEELLSTVDDPEEYNREVIFPTKVKMNRLYVENYSFTMDLMYILATIIPVIKQRVVPLFKSVTNER